MPASDAASHTRAFGEFAVAEQDVGVVIQLVETRGQRHAGPDAQALAERAGGHVHERQARRRMAFEVAAVFAELQQIVHGKQTGFRPRGVKDRRGVPFGKNETVVVVIVRIFRVVTHVPEKQRRHHVRRRQARSRMAAARGGGGVNRMNAQLVRNALQQFNVSINHGARKLREKPAKAKNENRRIKITARIWPWNFAVSSESAHKLPAIDRLLFSRMPCEKSSAAYDAK